MTATCFCGSDLWDYRGNNPVTQPKPIGREYCGIVEEVGSAVKNVKPGHFSLLARFSRRITLAPTAITAINPLVNIANSSATRRRRVLRVPLADGTLVATPDIPSGVVQQAIFC